MVTTAADLDKPACASVGASSGEGVGGGAAGALRAEPATLAALDQFRSRLDHRFGARLRGMVLFGSRARGGHRPDSDADVAVFLQPIADPVSAQMDIAGDAYLVFLDTGLYIEPWVLRGSPENPDRTHAAAVVDTVCREGIRS